jgi:PAS domain S-box-containing protein
MARQFALKQLQSQVRLFFLLSICIFIAIGVLSSYHTIRWNQAHNNANRLEKQLAHISLLVSSLKEAESSQRGYIISGNEEFLAQYNHTMKQIPDLYEHIDVYATVGTLERARIQQIKSLADKRIQYLKNNIPTSKTKSSKPQANPNTFILGKEAMDNLLAEVDLLEKRSLSTYTTQLSNLEARARLVQLTQLTGICFGTLLLVLSYILLQQRLQQKHKSLQELKESNSDLEALIEERTQQLKSTLEELAKSNMDLSSGFDKLSQLNQDLSTSNNKLQQLNQELSQSSTRQTELIKANEKAQAQLSLAIEVSRLAFWEWHPAEDHIKGSHNLESLYGLKENELSITCNSQLTTLISFCVHEEDRQTLRSKLQQALERKTAFKFQYRVCWPDGSTRWLLSQGQVLNNSHTQGISVTGTVMDVTERKHAEDNLRESESLLQSILLNIGEGVIVTDTSGQIIVSNPEAIATYGIQKSSKTLYDWLNQFDLINPDDDSPVLHKDALSNAISGHLVENEEFCIRHPETGDTKILVCSARPLSNSRKEIMGSVILLRDATSTRMASIKLKDSEQLLQQVFEASADALFLVNIDSQVIEQCNQQAVELFEVESKEEIIGKPGQSYQKEAFTQKEIVEIVRQLKTKRFWSKDIEYVGTKGRCFWGNAAISLVNTAHKRFYLIRIRDITERKQTEELIHKSERLLHEIFEGSADALFLLNAQNNLIENYNQQAVKLFGFKDRQELIGVPGQVMHTSQVANIEAEDIRKELIQNGHMNTEVAYRSRTGREFWTSVTTTYITSEEDNYYLISIRDIDERKKAEEAIRNSQLELLREKRRTEEALRIIENDNMRKTKEIEEARRLQLSMLPQVAPQLKNIDVSFFMKTCTEVGGDYYDYKLEKDGTLLIAIGDATGHGLKAGIVVATVKSYFQTLAHRYEPSELLHRISEGIHNLQIRSMYMGLTVIRIKDHRLTIASSGMPPLFLYRQSNKALEEIAIKGFFLGSGLPQKFSQQHYELEMGDTLVALSDGLPELFNRKRELLGYEHIKTLLQEISHLSTPEIVAKLNDLAAWWGGKKPNEDDFTYVVLKAK